MCAKGSWGRGQERVQGRAGQADQPTEFSSFSDISWLTSCANSAGTEGAGYERA